MEVDVRIEGLKELMARLDELDALAQQRLLRRVIRRVAIPLERQASANARALAKSGALAASVKIVNVRAVGDEVVRVSVAPKSKDRTGTFVHNAFYRRRRKGIFYGHLVEFGHRIGTRKRGYLKKIGRAQGAGSSSGGSVAGRPWFTSAVRSTQAQMPAAFSGLLAEALRRMERNKAKKTAAPDRLVDP